MDDGAPLWPRSPASRLWLRRKLRQRDVTAGPAAGPLSTLYPYQREVLQRPERFKALRWGRRRGKTRTGRGWLADGLLNDPQGTESLFFALTAESARGIFWRPLRELDSELRLGLKFDESKWTVTGPGRQILTVTGAETIRSINRKRGFGFKRIWGSEISSFDDDVLRYILQDVLEPTMMDDPESEMIWDSTPGEALNGLWWEISTGQVPGWFVSTGDARDNPKIRDQPGGFEGFIQGVMERWNWTIDHPKLRREYFGEWVAEPSRLVFRFDPTRNVLRELPQLVAGDHWVFFVAMDFGYGDATACVVLAWAKTYGRAVYVVDAWAERGLLPHEYEPRLRATVDKWRPVGIVGDVNALGKPYQMFWNRAHPGLEMMAAQKSEKRAVLEFVSDALSSASFGGDVKHHYGLAVLESVDQRLRRQLATLIWDEDRKDIKDGQDDDLAMALVYGWRQSPAFLNATAEPEPPKVYGQGNTWGIAPPRPKPHPLASAFSAMGSRRGKR